MSPPVWLLMAFWNTGGGSGPAYVVVTGPTSSANCESTIELVMSKATPPGQSVTATCAESRPYVDGYIGKYHCTLTKQQQLDPGWKNSDGKFGIQPNMEYDYSCIGAL